VAIRGPLPADDSAEGGDSLFAEINITPLTDVMLVLLIIFMVSSSAMVDAAREGQLEVDLPTAGAAVTSTPIPEALVVSILKDGRVAVAGEVTPDDQVHDVLKLRLEKNPKLALVIDADGDLAHRKVVRVIDEARQAGFTDVGIGVMPGTGP
jgi:biopolymer transport protein ExbD